MKKTLTIIAVAGGLLTAQFALAVCPVCALAVVGGVELSRWLGVDDTITGAWIGGLVISLSLWLVNWLKNKKINFRGLPAQAGLTAASLVLFYATTLLSLYWMKMIWVENCQKLWGYDKLLVGIVFGSLAFVIGAGLNAYLKKSNLGKAYFPFQKVVLPVGFLIIVSLVFHFITKCNPFNKFF
jgi:hypothetical protein